METSLGGIFGMVIAATEGAPVRWLVLNDAGPFILGGALERDQGLHGACLGW